MPATGGVGGIRRTSTASKATTKKSPTLQALIGSSTPKTASPALNAILANNKSSSNSTLMARAANAPSPLRVSTTSSRPAVTSKTGLTRNAAGQVSYSPSGTLGSKTASSGAPGYAGSTGASGVAATQALANQAAAATGGATSGSASGATGGATSAFGKSFTPDSAEMMRNNPDALIAAYFKHRGLGANTGLQAMSQEQNGDRLRLLHMLFGSRDENKLGQIGDYLDYSQGMLGQAMTPGGKYYGSQDILNKLFTKNPDDPIFQRLYGAELTPADQSGRFVDAYATANSATMDPWMLDAQISRLTQLENEWIAASAQGKTGEMNWADYVKKNGFGV